MIEFFCIASSSVELAVSFSALDEEKGSFNIVPKYMFTSLHVNLTSYFHGRAK